MYPDPVWISLRYKYLYDSAFPKKSVHNSVRIFNCIGNCVPIQLKIFDFMPCENFLAMLGKRTWHNKVIISAPQVQ